MRTGRAFLLLCIPLIVACRKDRDGDAEEPGVPTTVPVTFGVNVPGNMHDAAWGSGATCFALMAPIIPYNVWQLVKLDADGESIPQFAPVWPGTVTQGRASATDDSGCVVIASHNDHLLVARLDANGTLLASRAYDFPGYDTPRGITRIGPDVWVVVGYRQYGLLIDSVYHSRQDIWAMAVNIDGDSLWKRDFNDGHFRWPMSTVGLANGDVLVASYHSEGPTDIGNAFRVNALGDLVWSHDVGPATGVGMGVCETASGDLVFATSRYTEPSTFHGALYATTAAGAPLWQRTFGHADADVWPLDVAVDESGSIAVVGRYTDAQSLDRRLYVAGFGSDGSLAWERYAADNDTLAEGRRVIADAPGHFRLVGTGYPRPNGTIYYFTFLKGLSSAGVFD